jgi:arylformamidase
VLYDISSPLSERLAVWPGDVPFRREIRCDHAAGDPYALSALHTTAHVGTHADAFRHLRNAAPTIDEMDLDYYIGPCQIIRVQVPSATAVNPSDLSDSIQAPRILLATGTYPDETRFTENFAALSVELVDWLIPQGVKLIGIDTPSVDLFRDDALPVHHRLAAARVAALEGLRLAHVPPGLYELIAPPLRIAGGDGSPVRAIVRSEP